MTTGRDYGMRVLDSRVRRRLETLAEDYEGRASLAEALGVSRSTVDRAINGVQISAVMRERLRDRSLGLEGLEAIDEDEPSSPTESPTTGQAESQPVEESRTLLQRVSRIEMLVERIAAAVGVES